MEGAVLAGVYCNPFLHLLTYPSVEPTLFTWRNENSWCFFWHKKPKIAGDKGSRSGMTCFIEKPLSSMGLGWIFYLHKNSFPLHMMDSQNDMVSFLFVLNQQQVFKVMWYFYFINWSDIDSNKNLIATDYSLRFLEVPSSLWKSFLSLDSICRSQTVQQLFRQELPSQWYRWKS